MAIAEALGRLPLFVRIPLLVVFGVFWCLSGVFRALLGIEDREEDPPRRKRWRDEDEYEDEDYSDPDDTGYEPDNPEPEPADAPTGGATE